jgi:hypothetical protein
MEADWVAQNASRMQAEMESLGGAERAAALVLSALKK